MRGLLSRLVLSGACLESVAGITSRKWLCGGLGKKSSPQPLCSNPFAKKPKKKNNSKPPGQPALRSSTVYEPCEDFNDEFESSVEMNMPLPQQEAYDNPFDGEKLKFKACPNDFEDLFMPDEENDVRIHFRANKDPFSKWKYHKVTGYGGVCCEVQPKRDGHRSAFDVFRQWFTSQRSGDVFLEIDSTKPNLDKAFQEEQKQLEIKRIVDEATAQTHEYIMQDREVQMKKINRDLQILHDLHKYMNTQVHDQQIYCDQIESNVNATREQTLLARDELRIAANRQ